MAELPAPGCTAEEGEGSQGWVDSVCPGRRREGGVGGEWPFVHTSGNNVLSNPCSKVQGQGPSARQIGLWCLSGFPLEFGSKVGPEAVLLRAVVIVGVSQPQSNAYFLH